MCLFDDKESELRPYKLETFLQTQKQSLNYFFEHLDLKQIEELIERLAKVKGTIFFSGVGKSGFIAQKITATFVSMGIKSYFLSPIDALHGDLGIVDEQDVLLILSKSGESEEFLNLIPFIRNRSVSITSIVCKKKNRLVSASDYFIFLPLEKELCPHDIVPTTSAELQLIFGDLLAVALMQKKNLSLESFKYNHPAGKIGKLLNIRVKDLMIPQEKVPFCKQEDLVVDVIKELSAKRCGCVLIIDERKTLLGIFTDGDLRRALEKYGPEIFELKMSDLNIHYPQTIHEDKLAVEAMRLMEADQKKPFMVLPVINEHKEVKGLIKMHDVLQSGIN